MLYTCLLYTSYDLGKDLPSRGLSVGCDLINNDCELRQEYKECMFARVWKEFGFERWGRLYCYVDYAKFEAYNPELSVVCLLYTSCPEGSG